MTHKSHEIFEHAIGLQVKARAAYLNQTCGSDLALRAEVDRLLAAHDQAGDFLGKPTAERSETPTAGATMGVSDPEEPGAKIGPYKLLQLIGEGGFGSVFMAEQEKPVSRKVALKVIKLGMDTRQVIARFEAERQALALMDHPNIAKVLDAGATDAGRPYFVMELCKGDPIHEYCDKNNLSIHNRLELFSQVCLAVQHAHTKGIIHRDIKPSNVLVSTQDGRPHAKVIDFGIAKATASKLTEKTLFTEHRSLVGTPEYMSPEQAEGSLDIDTRTDVYSLGVLMYELLTGTTPFSSKELRSAAYGEIQRIIREVEPPKPSTRLSHNTETIASVAAHRQTEPRKLGTLVRGELDWIVMKALDKDRQRRYESANGLAMDVRRYLASEAVLAAPPSTVYRARKLVRRHRAKVAAGVLVTVALMMGLAGTAWQARVASKQRDLALDAQRAAQESAAGELAANQRSQARLKQIERANAILGSIFDSLDPDAARDDERPLRAQLVEHLDRAVAELQGDAVGEPLVVADLQVRLGDSLLGLGEPAKAEQVYRAALATYKDQLGGDHANALKCMNNVAMSLSAQGKIDQALPLQEESLKLALAKLGPDDTDTLINMNNLGLNHQAAGHIPRAIELYEDALGRMRTKLGDRDPNTLKCMSNLASACLVAQKFARAQSLCQESLRITRELRGREHPETLGRLNGLAAVYRARGRHDLVVPLMEDILKARRAQLGSEHPKSLESMANLAAAYYAVGNVGQAMQLLEEAVPLMKSKLGSSHPSTLEAMNNLASIYWTLKSLDKSIPLFEATLSAREKTLGPQHPDTLATGANLGVNYVDAGRADDAVPLLERAFHAISEYPQLEFASQGLLNAYLQTGRSEDAIQLLPTVLASLRAASPPQSLTLAGRLAALSVSLLQAQAFATAEPLLRESLAIRQSQAPDAWTTSNTKSMLGAALAGQKKFGEAEPLLLDGYAELKSNPSVPSPAQIGVDRCGEALKRIVTLYEAWHKDDPGKGHDTKAAEWKSTLETASAPR